MAKPTAFATPICIGLMVLAAIGIVIGIATTNPIWPMILLLPTIGYEVYRTEGKSTKAASWGLLAIFVLELIFLIWKIDFDLGAYLGLSEAYVSGYAVPLGDVRVVAPAVMAVLAVVLFVRTWGVYTKWLAAIIFITSFAIVYSLDPNIFHELLRMGAREAQYRY